MPDDFSIEQTLAVLRREFAATLPARLQLLRQALADLRHGVTPGTIQAFYLPTHSLQGTAGSYGADELVPAVSRLAVIGRRWRDAGRVVANELRDAALELDVLEGAIERYRIRVA